MDQHLLSIILFALLAIALGGLILSVWDAFEPAEAVLAATAARGRHEAGSHQNEANRLDAGRHAGNG